MKIHDLLNLFQRKDKKMTMEKMLTDEPMRKSMAGKARKMIADRFEKNFVQKSQIEFYEEIMRG